MPTAGIHRLKFLERSTIGQTIKRAHSIEDQGAFEMVELVQPDPGMEPVGFELERLTFEIERLDPDEDRSPNRSPDIRETQADLLITFERAGGFEDLGIDEDRLLLPLLFGVADEHADGMPDLGRCETDP